MLKTTAVITVLFFVLAVGVILFLFPQKIQEYELGWYGKRERAPHWIPRFLQPLAAKLKQLEYASKSGEDYRLGMRLMGGLTIVMVIIVLFLVFRGH